jgi:hypothetical protein
LPPDASKPVPAWIVDFIRGAKWQFAKTMPWHPHSYTVRRWHTERGTEETFECFVLHIREHGYEDSFGKRRFVYFDVGPFRFWSMGNPLAETTIVNRAFGHKPPEHG